METSAPLVSVIIPCHNAGRWIAETIASVISQRNVPLEIVLVDDGSEDDTVEIALGAAPDAVLRIVRQPNSGVSRARNVGTALSRGVFLQYLDADDVLMPDTLETKVDALIAGGGDVVYCDWIWWTRQPDGTFFDAGVVSRSLGPRPDVDVLTDSWWPLGALLYRRAIADRIGPWREDLPIIQDARFLLDAALRGARFVQANVVGAKYRVHGSETVSRRDPCGFLDDCFRSASELHDAWEHDAALDEERRAGLLKVYSYVARSFFPLDRERFRDVVARLTSLEPRFAPQGPPAFRALSRLIGYPAAEHVAGSWRQLKTVIGQAR